MKCELYRIVSQPGPGRWPDAPCTVSVLCTTSAHHSSWQRPYLEKEVMKLFSMHRTM